MTANLESESHTDFVSYSSGGPESEVSFSELTSSSWQSCSSLKLSRRIGSLAFAPPGGCLYSLACGPVPHLHSTPDLCFCFYFLFSLPSFLPSAFYQDPVITLGPHGLPRISPSCEDLECVHSCKVFLPFKDTFTCLKDQGLGIFQGPQLYNRNSQLMGLTVTIQCYDHSILLI